MYRQYSAIACPSQAIADSLAQWAPQVRERICVIPNAIAIERFAAASAADKGQIVREGDPPVILFTARLQPQKDHVTLFHALKQIGGAHLLLAGDGELRPRLMRLAQELGLSSRIHFLGRRDDIPQLLKMADVYAHSSHSEGFGIAALEAMAAGVPVVVSNLPGLAEVVGQAGILVPPGDSEAMANALKQVLGEAFIRGTAARPGIFHPEDDAAVHRTLWAGSPGAPEKTAPLMTARSPRFEPLLVSTNICAPVPNPLPQAGNAARARAAHAR